MANNHNNEITSDHLVLAVFITSILTALILLLVAFSVKHLRQRLCSEEMKNGNTNPDDEQEMKNGNTNPDGEQEEMKNGNTSPNDQQEDISEVSTFLGSQDSLQSKISDGDDKRKSNPTFHTALSVELIVPCDIKGPISHLCCRKTNGIWVSNDRGQLGLINHSGKSMWSYRTCTTYSGHFTIATDNDSKVERIYWVHKEEKRVYRFDYQDNSMSDTTSHDQLGEVVEEMPWEPISILFSDKTWTESDKGKKYIFVGKVAHNDAKITRYMDGKKLVKVNDIHTCKYKSTYKRIYQYPAYLAENNNGDICASDDNRCVVVVDKDYTFRFSYTGHGQKGFTPYGISTDGSGQILILDSCSRRIHILDQNGKYQRDLGLPDDLKQPRGLCIEDNGRCYVGSYGSISVYNY